jgi:hypothetical protein
MGAVRHGEGVVDKDAAERFYSDSWKSTIAQRYGAQPEILFFETPVIVENAQQSAATAAA